VAIIDRAPAHPTTNRYEQVENRRDVQLAVVADHELGVTDPAPIGCVGGQLGASRFAATGWSWSLMVVPLNCFRTRAFSPSSCEQGTLLESAHSP